MEIRNIRHKGLRRFVVHGDTSGIPADAADKLGKMVSFLQDMKSAEELKAVPSWRAHQLTGDRKGIWSLFVTRNWRLTFRIEIDDPVIADLDYQDYH